MNIAVRAQVPLGHFMLSRGGSTDPSRQPKEPFVLYSIPAFDVGQPELVRGSDIGSPKKDVQSGDVLLSRIVPHIRRSWIVGEHPGKKILASGEWIVFRSNEIHASYLRHFLISDIFHQQFMQTVAGVGGSLLRANPNYVSKITIPIPSLDEQRRISAILDTADALRRKRKRALDLLENLTQSMFLQMFGDALNRPGICKPISLQEFVDIQVGFAFKSADYTESDDGIRLCRGANILPNRMDWSDLARWPKERKDEFLDYQLQEGDIVIAMDRPWISSGFKVAQITSKDLPALLVQRVARLRPKNRDDGEFLFALIRNQTFTSHFKPTETTVPHISPTEIRNFSLHFPRLNARKAFADFSRRVCNLARVAVSAAEDSENLFSSLQYRAFSDQL